MCGDAIEVPDIVQEISLHCVLRLAHTERTRTPGAWMSTTDPKLEKYAY
jgi:hypothetical protein